MEQQINQVINSTEITVHDKHTRLSVEHILLLK